MKNEHNPHGITLGQTVAILHKRKPVRSAIVSHVTKHFFHADHNVYQLASLTGRGHPGTISVSPKDVAEAERLDQVRADEIRASVKAKRAFKLSPGYSEAQRLLWGHLDDETVLRRWMALGPDRLRQLLSDLQAAGVNV